MISSIVLQNFKNLNTKFSFSEGINVITGDNGKGKSNLLESIFLLVNGFMYKAIEDSDVVSWTYAKEFNLDPFYNVSGKILNEERQVVFQGKKTFKINGKNVRASSFESKSVAIIFSPSSIDLISDTPSGRRDEIDNFISLIDVKYKKKIDEYKKVVRSRNKLLQINPEDISSQIVFWNKKVAILGAEIIAERLKNLRVLEKIASKVAKEVYHFGENTFELKYMNKYRDLSALTTEEISEQLLKQLNENWLKEVIVGSTLYGPHRDDIDVSLNGKPLKESGSRGQQRLASFILKLSEYEVLKGVKESVIFLVDDLPAELDKTHVKNAESIFKQMDIQVILTAVDKHEYSDSFISSSHLISL